MGGVGEPLADDVGAIAGEQGGYGRLCLSVGALDVLLIVVLVTVGTVVGERGIGAEAVLKDVETDRLRELSVSGDSGIAGGADQLLCGLIGNDVDDTGDGVGAVERGGGTVEDLDTFDARHADARQVDVVRDVAREFLAVDEDEDVLVAQAVETQEGSHGVWSHRHLRHHARQGTVEGGDTLFADLLGREDVNGRGGTFQTLMVAGAGHDHGVQMIRTADHGGVHALHPVDLRENSAPRKERCHQSDECFIHGNKENSYSSGYML